MARRKYSELVDVLSGVIAGRALMTREDAEMILNQFTDDGFHWARVNNIVSLSLLGLLPEQIVDTLKSGLYSVDVVSTLIRAQGLNLVDGYLDYPPLED